LTVCLPEDDADALKHVGVLTLYKILLIYVGNSKIKNKRVVMAPKRTLSSNR